MKSPQKLKKHITIKILMFSCKFFFQNFTGEEAELHAINRYILIDNTDVKQQS